jgi:hypothetical protein
MLISHSKKFIFLKTYKTGSSSIESVLRKYCGVTEFDLDDRSVRGVHNNSVVSEDGIITFPRYRGSIDNGLKNGNKDYYWDHMTASELKEKIGTEIWDSYYKFCVVRNPFEKVLSLLYFFYFRSMENRCCGGYVGDNVKKEWIFELVSKNFGRRMLLGYDNFFDSEIYTMNGDVCVDRVLRYENLDTEFSEVLEYLGLIQEDLPRINSTYKDKDIRPEQFLSSDMISFIRNKYAFEIERFGYDI